jgi:osmotically inducible protein OsmC
MKRTASAVWKGNLKEGAGILTTQSAVLNQTPYSFRSRFGDGTETNPEELIAAAHAGCFSMALSMILKQGGFVADSIETKAVITLDVATTTITKIDLELAAKIPKISEAQFKEMATAAEKNCPVSKVLKAEITLSATLVS